MREAAIAAQLPVSELPIYGSDLYGDALKAAHQNLEEAGIRETVDLKQCNVLEASPPEKEGILVANLPYGERMGDEDELAELVSATGRRAEKEIRRLESLPVYCRPAHRQN